LNQGRSKSEFDVVDQWEGILPQRKGKTPKIEAVIRSHRQRLNVTGETRLKKKSFFDKENRRGVIGALELLTGNAGKRNPRGEEGNS